MTADDRASELLDSLDRHFMAGCPSLSAVQLAAHEKFGTCGGCRVRAQSARQESEPLPAGAS